MSTDREFADYLKSLARTMTAEEVGAAVQSRDAELGEYISPELSVHHYEEARH